jgi:hypothetical protein
MFEADPENSTNRERNFIMRISTFVSTLAFGLLVSGGAFALDAADAPKPAASPTPVATPAPVATPTPAATPKAAKAKPDDAEREAKSAECSKTADAKGLHGKPRKKFRAECLKGN